MFAAAAVAAAAALTAISTTTAQPSNFHTGIQKNSASNSASNSEQQRAKNYISWHQYAHERRNSLQRRKIEITKRLEKATNANNPNNNNNNNKSKINLVNLERETDAFKSKTNPVNPNHNFLKMPPNSNATNSSNLKDVNKNEMNPNERLKVILGQNNSLGDIKLSTEICNEFLKIHKICQNELSALDELKALETDPNNPTYSNFANLLSHLNGNDPENNPTLELAEISEVLLEYLAAHQSKNNGSINYENMESFGEFMHNHFNQENQKKTSFTANKFQSAGKHLMKESNRKQEENLTYALNHRWDPKWLKTIRKTLCIPFAFITLIFLLFSNVSSNWIKFEENERAGLWSVCNKTKIYNTNLNDNENSTLLVRVKIHNSRELFIQSNVFENCYSKFFLKEDAHLAVLALSLVALLFHTIGLVLMFVGFTYTTSSKTLYFHHSAGECLITSALVNGLDLLAFVYLVSSQIEQAYIYGYCFYMNLLIALLTFGYSIFLYMDDIVNEFRLWKLRKEIIKKRKAANYLPP